MRRSETENTTAKSTAKAGGSSSRQGKTRRQDRESLLQNLRYLRDCTNLISDLHRVAETPSGVYLATIAGEIMFGDEARFWLGQLGGLAAAW